MWLRHKHVSTYREIVTFMNVNISDLRDALPINQSLVTFWAWWWRLTWAKFINPHVYGFSYVCINSSFKQICYNTVRVNKQEHAWRLQQLKSPIYLGDFSAIEFVYRLEAPSEKKQHYRHHISIVFCFSLLHTPSLFLFLG